MITGVFVCSEADCSLRRAEGWRLMTEDRRQVTEDWDGMTVVAGK